MKHDNYSEWVEITIVRHDDKFYTLEYTAPSDERYELYGTKDEILAELGEHMELMYEKS